MLAVVPTELSNGGVPELEFRPVDEVDPEAPLGYIATGRANEIADIVLAIASFARKPLRRGAKPGQPPLH